MVKDVDFDDSKKEIKIYEDVELFRNFAILFIFFILLFNFCSGIADNKHPIVVINCPFLIVALCVLYLSLLKLIKKEPLITVSKDGIVLYDMYIFKKNIKWDNIKEIKPYFKNTRIHIKLHKSISFIDKLVDNTYSIKVNSLKNCSADELLSIFDSFWKKYKLSSEEK